MINRIPVHSKSTTNIVSRSNNLMRLSTWHDSETQLFGICWSFYILQTITCTTFIQCLGTGFETVCPSLTSPPWPRTQYRDTRSNDRQSKRSSLGKFSNGINKLIFGLVTKYSFSLAMSELFDPGEYYWFPQVFPVLLGCSVRYDSGCG